MEERGSIARCYHGRIRASLREIIRAAEWWEYKLVPILAMFYGSALVLDVAVSSLWRAALTVLLALVPGAIFVSVINDVTDREDDRAAGKPNRAEGRSQLVVATLLLTPIAAGLLFVFLWRHDRLLVSCYLAAWLAFSLYSLPPFRFKTRGLPGVLCDASGAHLFPTLVAVLLAFRDAQRPAPTIWLVAVALWSLSYGLRGILWHQLSDREHDRAAGVRTFAERHDPARAIWLGTWVAFPLEVAALLALLWQMQSRWPVAALAIYLLVIAAKAKLWRMDVIIVDPRPRYVIVLHDYYVVFLPPAVLLATALRHPADVAVIAAHVVLFPSCLLRGLEEMRLLAKLQKR